MRHLKINDLVTIALVAAILCILAPASITLGFTPIPITLGTFAVLMAGIILGRTRGTVCVLVYILLGAVGLPVFSGYMGGIQKILGPTGGYIWGYLFLVWLTGFFVEYFHGKWYMCFVGALLGTTACYGFGTLWMMLALNMSLIKALLAGVVPFLPFDLIKIAVAVAAVLPEGSVLVRHNLIRTGKQRE